MQQLLLLLLLHAAAAGPAAAGAAGHAAGRCCSETTCSQMSYSLARSPVRLPGSADTYRRVQDMDSVSEAQGGLFFVIDFLDLLVLERHRRSFRIVVAGWGLHGKSS